MIETIKNIGVILGATLSSITLLGVVIKPVRKKFVDWIMKTSKVEKTDGLILELKDSFDKFSTDIKKDIADLKADSELNKEANRCICSNRIANAADKYRTTEAIPSWEVDALIDHYTVYKKLGGNGKIERKYQELMDKQIRAG